MTPAFQEKLVHDILIEIEACDFATFDEVAEVVGQIVNEQVSEAIDNMVQEQCQSMDEFYPGENTLIGHLLTKAAEKHLG